MKETGKQLVVAIIVVPIIIIGVVFLLRRTPEPVYTVPRHIEYSFTIQNKTNHVVKGACFRTYAPVKQTSSQLCQKVESSYPFELIPDVCGNQVLQFSFAEFPPFSKKIISIRADLLLAEVPNRSSLDNEGAYLISEQYIESDNTEIIKKARELKTSVVKQTAKGIFDWVAGHIEYTGYIENERGALYAYTEKRGDCTEYMYLFAALCRADEIPARCVGGYICSENTILRPSGYHNWAEIYEDGAWKIADVQNRIYQINYEDYIAMRMISGASNNPIMSFSRFRLDGEGLKVQMN